MEKKYALVYSENKKRIINGEYPPHKKLPSKRVMADRLGVSVITVEKALSMLADEGYMLIQ